MQWLQHLKSQTGRPNIEHARKPLFRAAQHSQHRETSLQRAARPKKSPEGQTLYTRSIEFSMHINSSYNSVRQHDLIWKVGPKSAQSWYLVGWI